MNTIILADCLICAVVVIFALVALHRPQKADRKTEIKAALTYLVVALLLVLPLLIYQCNSNKP